MAQLAVLTSPSQLDDDNRLAAEITLLAGQINAANYRLLKLIAEFDDRQGWSGGGTVRSCAHWLNWQCGIALGAAREKVRVAHCLETLPLIDAAFATGEISYSKVRAMTRVATPDNEDFLLMIARHGTASHLEQVVNKFRRVQHAMVDEQRERQERERKLVYYQDDDGMWVIHAKLPAEEGTTVVKALEAIVRPIQEARQEQLREQRERVSAETSCDDNSEGVAVPEPRRFHDLLEQTRADALVTIAEHFVASGGNGERAQGLKGGERCQILLHVDLKTLQGHPDGTRPGVSPATARRLACDAGLVTVLEDDKGNVLNIGRRTRTVPPAIARALCLRDRTCRFPGCCESRYVDAHHVIHWAEGGETRLDNLVTLCRYHHRLLHRGAFSVAMDTSGDRALPVFKTPAGRRIETSIHPQFEGVSAETSLVALQRAAPDVDADTCITRWQGEDCDYGMVVDALLHRDQVRP